MLERLHGPGWALAALLLFTLAPPARADAPLFVWMDKNGDMHATDRLQSVPEPWHTMYEQRLKELDKQGRLPRALPTDTTPPPPVPTPVPLPSGPTAEQIAAQRAFWHALVSRWRAELAAATAALQQAEQAYEQAAINPILRETPGVKEQLGPLDDKRQAARARVEAARSMLQEVLPKKARDEHVPPLWLQ